VAKNCGRNESPNKVRAVDKVLSKPRKGSQEANGGASTIKKKVAPNGSKATLIAASGGAPVGRKGGAPGSLKGDALDRKQGAASGGLAEVAVQQNGSQRGSSGDADSQCGAGKMGDDGDEPMVDLQDHTGSGADGKEAPKDIEMHDSPSNAEVGRAVLPERQVKKIGKFDGADDFSSAKLQAAATEVANGQLPGLTGPPSSPRY
jgi:hypothetical protein